MSVISERGVPAVTAVAGAVGLGVVGFLVGAIVAVVLVGFIGSLVSIAPDSPAGSIVALVGQGIGLVVVGYLYLQHRERSLSYVRIERPTARDVGVVVVGTVGLFVVLAVSVTLVEFLGLGLAEHNIADLIETNPSVALLLIPASLLITGPVEEFLYRGVIQTRLRETLGVGVAVFVASLVFAAVHIPAFLNGSAPSTTLVTILFVLLPLGVVLGVLYEYTGNLFVPAVAHGIYNAVVFAAVYVDTVGL